MSIDLAAADELLTTTRAVRKRLDLTRPVPRQILIDCIRISQQAPTASNTQNWRWIIIDDAKKRGELARLYRVLADSYLAERGKQLKAGDDTQATRVHDSAHYLAKHLHEVPVLVVPCLEGAPFADHAASFYASIYPAVWSFQLALHARGLGSVLTTFHLMKKDEAAALLGLPDNITQCGLLPVAYTLGTDFKPAGRPAPETIIHWNGW